jgi:acetyl-CoA synthetase
MKPNLENYKKTYDNFNWKDYEQELERFEDGNINAAYNAVTRHANSDIKDKIALLWEGKTGSKKFSFAELEKESNKFANALINLGIKKGDRVFLFLPKIPETYISFLGILKMGAIAGTMFQAFGPDALVDRLKDSGANCIITDSTLVDRVYKVKNDLPELKHFVLVDKAKDKEISYQDIMQEASNEFEIVHTKATDPAFMLYTSGTTGKSKGVIHGHRAILQEHLTAKWVLDLKPKDIYWCTADPGWVTGIAYGILGNWSNGITTVVYDGKFSPENWYGLIQKYKISVWYTAPTAIRMLMKAGNEVVEKFNLSTLRHLCSVGEPLNPEAIKWGREVFDLSFHDTWWQTETGGMCIINYPGIKIKLGSMGKPFPGVEAAVVDSDGKKIVDEEGDLVLKPGWPSMMQEIWKNKKKYESYFKHGWYYSGDKAMQDKEGYFWFFGRADDVINTKGERVGPFEVESALVEHPGVVEAGVIGKPDKLYGEIIKAFVVLAKDYKPADDFAEEVKQFVKKRLAGHAYPSEVEVVEDLPKTRSGKIMRRVLKAKELGLEIKDTSTMEE